MRLCPGIFLSLILFSISTAANDKAGVLSRFTAHYDLSRNDISVGDTHISLELGVDDTYVYRAQTEPNGVLSLWREDLILEESSGRVLDGRPRPDHYLYHREGGGVNLHLELDFDWDNARVRISSGESHWSLAIGRNTLDKLVQQLVFLLDLAAGVKQKTYQVADGGLLKGYSYRVRGRETLEVPHGRYNAIKVGRSKDHGSADYTLWLAPELDYRPVCILRRHRGSRYLMKLKELIRESR